MSIPRWFRCVRGLLTAFIVLSWYNVNRWGNNCEWRTCSGTSYCNRNWERLEPATRRALEPLLLPILTSFANERNASSESRGQKSILIIGMMKSYRCVTDIHTKLCDVRTRDDKADRTIHSMYLWQAHDWRAASAVATAGCRSSRYQEIHQASRPSLLKHWKGKATKENQSRRLYCPRLHTANAPAATAIATAAIAAAGSRRYTHNNSLEEAARITGKEGEEEAAVWRGGRNTVRANKPLLKHTYQTYIHREIYLNNCNTYINYIRIHTHTGFYIYMYVYIYIYICIYIYIYIYIYTHIVVFV